MRDLSSILPLVEKPGPFNEVPDEYNAQDSLVSLATSKVLVIGAGGLGCEILKNLALTGFKDIHVIDMDTIELSNLNRQFLFQPQDIGKSKAKIASQAIIDRIGDSNLKITPYFGKIQDKPQEYYRQFTVVISGLDSIEARRWINATLMALVDDDILIPLIDGGTEGLRGQSRVILPTISSCFECSLDLISPKITYPVCTIANTPRLPEHCIEWANQLQWARFFPDKKFDADNPDDVDWMYQMAKARAEEFKIEGVTRQLTLGVVKNIIPAIASTNAIIAASCCNEAFKFVTNTNPLLNNYMMYSGDESIFTYTYPYTKKENCPVCGNIPKWIKAEKWWTLNQFIEELSTKQEIQMTRPSLTTSSRYLYLSNPEELEKLTRKNLSKKLKDLLKPGEEIVVTDPKLPISMKVLIEFVGPEVDPEFNK